MIYNFKSRPEHFEKEKSGVKPNTVRLLEQGDYRATMVKGDIVRIRNSDNENEWFERVVTDKTFCGEFLGKMLMVVSWNHKEQPKRSGVFR